MVESWGMLSVNYERVCRLESGGLSGVEDIRVYDALGSGGCRVRIWKGYGGL